MFCKEEIDIIENSISLLNTSIEFEEIIDSYLSGVSTDEEIKGDDRLSYRKRKLDQLQYRFKKIYNLDILCPENGCSVLNVKCSSNLRVKMYLHRFLSFKNSTGGGNANADGSAELFEDISANAVKNYLGDGSKSIMVGEGRANLTETRLKQISKEIHENTGLYDNLPNQAKDDGVDFIVYKPIDERNVGNLVILGQACIGKNFRLKKSIRQRWQNEYITYAVKPPTTLLSIVCFLEADELKKVHSDFDNSIVFDKGRIMKYYNTNDKDLNSRIINFVNENINDD